MSQFKESTLWELSGPAGADWYALVLSPEAMGDTSLPEVLVAPVRAGLPRSEVTDHDVFCDASASPTKECLTFAAWAVAPMPSHCLKREVGCVDPMLVARVRETHDNLVASPAFPKFPYRSRRGEPAWHNELRESLTGYWDGSVMISCATLPAGEEELIR